MYFSADFIKIWDNLKTHIFLFWPYCGTYLVKLDKTQAQTQTHLKPLSFKFSAVKWHPCQLEVKCKRRNYKIAPLWLCTHVKLTIFVANFTNGRLRNFDNVKFRLYQSFHKTKSNNKKRKLVCLKSFEITLCVLCACVCVCVSVCLSQRQLYMNLWVYGRMRNVCSQHRLIKKTTHLSTCIFLSFKNIWLFLPCRLPRLTGWIT